MVNMDGNHMLVCFTVPYNSVDCRPFHLLLNVLFYVSSINLPLIMSNKPIIFFASTVLIPQ